MLLQAEDKYSRKDSAHLTEVHICKYSVLSKYSHKQCSENKSPGEVPDAANLLIRKTFVSEMQNVSCQRKIFQGKDYYRTVRR